MPDQISCFATDERLEELELLDELELLLDELAQLLALDELELELRSVMTRLLELLELELLEQVFVEGI